MNVFELPYKFWRNRIKSSSRLLIKQWGGGFCHLALKLQKTAHCSRVNYQITFVEENFKY